MALRPKISVVTISFNQSRYLRRCLESVAGQQGADFEHLIVDPGSTDDSREIIDGFGDSRVKPIYMPDLGPADGLNNGFAAAVGDVIMYINADDELAPGSLALIAGAHAEAPDVDVLIGNGWLIDANSQPRQFLRSDRFTHWRAAAGVGTVVQQATSIKRSALATPRPFNPKNRYSWDFELLCDLYAARCKFAYTPEALGYFRMYDGTISSDTALKAAIAMERRAVLSKFLSSSSLRGAALSEYGLRAGKRLRKLAYTSRVKPFFAGSVASSSETIL